jgi:hypothetical protein
MTAVFRDNPPFVLALIACPCPAVSASSQTIIKSDPLRLSADRLLTLLSHFTRQNGINLDFDHATALSHLVCCRTIRTSLRRPHNWSSSHLGSETRHQRAGARPWQRGRSTTGPVALSARQGLPQPPVGASYIWSHVRHIGTPSM